MPAISAQEEQLSLLLLQLTLEANSALRERSVLKELLLKQTVSSVLTIQLRDSLSVVNVPKDLNATNLA